MLNKQSWLSRIWEHPSLKPAMAGVIAGSAAVLAYYSFVAPNGARTNPDAALTNRPRPGAGAADPQPQFVAMQPTAAEALPSAPAAPGASPVEQRKPSNHPPAPHFPPPPPETAPPSGDTPSPDEANSKFVTLVPGFPLVSNDENWEASYLAFLNDLDKKIRSLPRSDQRQKLRESLQGAMKEARANLGSKVDQSQAIQEIESRMMNDTAP